MIILLSPAKTLNFNDDERQTFSQPRLLQQSETLVNELRTKTGTELQKLMKVSEKIATENVARYQDFRTPFHPDNAKQALFTFNGDVYMGLRADDLESEDVEFAQRHVRILSGLYGVLRPLDLMQAYRLEMGTKLRMNGYRNLYEFWGDRITDTINDDLAASGSNIVLNLASQEYFKALQPNRLRGRVIDVHFKEYRDDKLKVITFNAKRARGDMARQIILGRITQPEELTELEVLGYRYEDNLSNEYALFFTK